MNNSSTLTSLSCLYKSTISKIPECNAHGYKIKAGEARCWETTEVFPDSKFEKSASLKWNRCAALLLTTRRPNSTSTEQWQCYRGLGASTLLLTTRRPNSTSTEQWQCYRVLDASRLIWSTCYFEFIERRRLLKEDDPLSVCVEWNPGAGIERPVLPFHHENDPLLQPTNFPSHILYALLGVTTGRFHGVKVKQIVLYLGLHVPLIRVTCSFNSSIKKIRY